MEKGELFVSEEVLQTWSSLPFFFEIRPQNGVFYPLSRLAWGESLHGTASEEL